MQIYEYVWSEYIKKCPKHSLVSYTPDQRPGLYVFDPKALHHIIVKDQAIFEEAPWNIAYAYRG